MRGNRRSIRLPGYDYTGPGAYFVTLNVQNAECLFGEIHNGDLRLNKVGEMVLSVWMALPARFPTTALDALVIMPNHLHAILILKAAPLVGASTRDAPTLGDIVGAFKSITTVRYIYGVKRGQWPEFNRRIWQRNYYEHIIRHEDALRRIRWYIAMNPEKWERDRENPRRSS